MENFVRLKMERNTSRNAPKQTNSIPNIAMKKENFPVCNETKKDT